MLFSRTLQSLLLHHHAKHKSGRKGILFSINPPFLYFFFLFVLLQWSRMGETERAGRVKVFMCPTLPLLINEVCERSRESEDREGENEEGVCTQTPERCENCIFRGMLHDGMRCDAMLMLMLMRRVSTDESPRGITEGERERERERNRR